MSVSFAQVLGEAFSLDDDEDQLVREVTHLWIPEGRYRVEVSSVPAGGKATPSTGCGLQSAFAGKQRAALFGWVGFRQLGSDGRHRPFRQKDGDGYLARALGRSRNLQASGLLHHARREDCVRTAPAVGVAQDD